MKKVSLVMLESRRRDALGRLRQAGVLHVQGAGKSSAELEAAREDISLVERALAAFPPGKKGEAGRASFAEDPLKLAAKIADLAEQRRILREEADRIAREIDKYEPWGDFDPETLAALSARGVFVRMYEIGKKDLKRFAFSGLSYTVFSTKEKTGILALVRGEADFPPGFEALPAPAKSLSRLRETLAEKRDGAQALSGQIEGYGACRDALRAEAGRLRARAEFEQTAADLVTAEEKLAYLQGFVPETKTDDLKALAAKEGWALLVDDPCEDDIVPTLLKNPKPVRLIKPVMDFLGLVPGYRERDISFFFILFFSVFVAMIIGDAGYAALFLAASIFFGLKTRKKLGYMPDAFILFIVMGLCTFIWGAMTCNFFGITKVSTGIDLKTIAPFSLVYVEWLVDEKTGQSNVQLICFVLAVTHLCIARTWNFFHDLRQTPRIKAFVHLGYLGLLLGLFTLVLSLLIDSNKFPFPYWPLPETSGINWAMIAIGIGYVFVLFLSQQDGNFFKGMLMGLAQFIPTTLGCISVFADIISYVRLFAVGLAGLAIAESFNSLAQGIMSGGGALIIPGILVIIFGHTLNMGMCILSVVVHGVRLNVLEFSNHLGLEWSGFAYNPFREKEETAQAS
jgi:V/A-type H+-transporting ATPase subunit I